MEHAERFVFGLILLTWMTVLMNYNLQNISYDLGNEAKRVRGVCDKSSLL